MPIEIQSLKVATQQGQKTLDVANHLRLIDRKFEIQRNKDFLYLPLINEPSDHDLKILKDSGINFVITASLFQDRKKERESLIEQLEGRLPPRLLAGLPHSIDFVGDIAIIEIPMQLRTYKKVIGEAILRSNKNLHTVLAKAGAVNGTYRTRVFDFLAGEQKTNTLHKEHGCQYRVDLAKAYFSPRLSHEHKRVASSVQEGETVMDMFAGVGPFAILIAKTHENVQVYAIDVNPDAVEYMKINVRINKVTGKVHPLLGDARQVIKGKTLRIADRIIMNLPENAIEFVDVACHALKMRGGIIHFYFFMNPSNSLETAKAHFAEAVVRSGRRVENIIGERIVRETAPYEAQAVLDVRVI